MSGSRVSTSRSNGFQEEGNVWFTGLYFPL